MSALFQKLSGIFSSSAPSIKREVNEEDTYSSVGTSAGDDGRADNEDYAMESMDQEGGGLSGRNYGAGVKHEPLAEPSLPLRSPGKSRKKDRKRKRKSGNRTVENVKEEIEEVEAGEDRTRNEEEGSVQGAEVPLPIESLAEQVSEYEASPNKKRKRKNKSKKGRRESNLHPDDINEPVEGLPIGEAVTEPDEIEEQGAASESEASRHVVRGSDGKFQNQRPKAPRKKKLAQPRDPAEDDGTQGSSWPDESISNSNGRFLKTVAADPHSTFETDSAPPEIEDDDPEAMANMLNASIKPRNGPAGSPATVATTPQVIIRAGSRPTLLSVSNSNEIRNSSPLAREIPSDLTELPQKIKKAKRRLSKSKASRRKDLVIDESEEDTDAVLHQPLTPATTNHLQVRMSLQSQPEDRSQHSQNRDDENADSLPLRKNALGKRKASDTVLRTANKRHHLQDDNTNGDIRPYTRILPPVRNLFSKPSQPVFVEPQNTPKNLSGLSQNEKLISAAQSSSQPSKTLVSSQPSRGRTPQWTPINKVGLTSKSTKVSISQSTPQVVLPWKAAAITVERLPRESEADELTSDVEEFKSQKQLNNLEQTSKFAHDPEYSDRINSEDDDDSPAPSTIRRKRRLPVAESAKKKSAKVNDNDITPKRVRSRPHRSPAPPRANGTNLPSTDIETIEGAVEDFRLENGLEQSALNALVQQSVTSAKTAPFWNDVCHAVAHIPKKKVINFCRRRYHNFIKGSWSIEQDEELRDAHQRFPNKWTKISQLVNRSSEDVRLRWRDYLSLENQKKADWSSLEEDRLMTIVSECIEKIREQKLVSSDPRFINKDDESLLDWTTVSTMMDKTRSRLQCFIKWQNIKARIDSEGEDAKALAPITTTSYRLEKALEAADSFGPQEKLRLLRLIQASGAGRERKIPWRMLRKDLGLRGIDTPLRVCFRNMRIQIEGHEDMKVQPIVSRLIEIFETAEPNEPPGFHSSAPIRELLDLHNTQGKTPRKSRKKSSKKDKRSKTNEDADGSVPKRKRTIRERVTKRHELLSKEIVESSDDSVIEDVGDALRSAWSEVSTPRAKQPIMQPKTSQRRKPRSAEVSESEDLGVPNAGSVRQRLTASSTNLNGTRSRSNQSEDSNTQIKTARELDVDDAVLSETGGRSETEDAEARDRPSMSRVITSSNKKRNRGASNENQNDNSFDSSNNPEDVGFIAAGSPELGGDRISSSTQQSTIPRISEEKEGSSEDEGGLGDVEDILDDHNLAVIEQSPLRDAMEPTGSDNDSNTSVEDPLSISKSERLFEHLRSPSDDDRSDINNMEDGQEVQERLEHDHRTLESPSDTGGEVEATEESSEEAEDTEVEDDVGVGGNFIDDMAIEDSTSESESEDSNKISANKVEIRDQESRLTSGQESSEGGESSDGDADFHHDPFVNLTAPPAVPANESVATSDDESDGKRINGIAPESDDDDHLITMNGFNREDTVDSDTSEESAGLNSFKSATPVPVQLNGFRQVLSQSENGTDSDSSSSGSDTSIPPVPRRITEAKRINDAASRSLRNGRRL